MNSKKLSKILLYSVAGCLLLVGLLWGIFKREQQQVQIQRDIMHARAKEYYRQGDIIHFATEMNNLQPLTWHEIQSLSARERESLREMYKSILDKDFPEKPTLASEMGDLYRWSVERMRRIGQLGIK